MRGVRGLHASSSLKRSLTLVHVPVAETMSASSPRLGPLAVRVVRPSVEERRARDIRGYSDSCPWSLQSTERAAAPILQISLKSF